MYTRRQELICTENQMIAKPGVVLRDGEVIRIRMNNGQIYEKMGDGVTPIIDLPYNINSEFAERAERAANEAAENAREEVSHIVGELGIVQTTGTSETAVMSQKATTDEVGKVRNNAANVVKARKTAKDRMDSIDDISPNKHQLVVKLKSKNLLTYPYVQMASEIFGVTFTHNPDGSFVINGTPTTTIIKTFCYIDLGDRYFATPTKQIVNGEEVLTNFKSDKYTLSGVDENDNGLRLAYNETEKSVYLAIPEGKTFTNKLIKPQLEEGKEATEWQSPVVGDNVGVIHKKRNLISYPYTPNPPFGTYSGVTFTDNGDGSISIKGANTSANDFYFNIFQSGDDFGSNDMWTKYANATSNTAGYVISGAPTNDGACGYWLLYVGSTKQISLVIKGNAAVDATVYPQIERGTVATHWQTPLLKEDKIVYPNVNGDIIGVDSTELPLETTDNSLTLFLEVSYNKDVNKALVDAIEDATNTAIKESTSFRYEDCGLPVVFFYGDTTGMTKDDAVTLNYKYDDRIGSCTLKWQGSSSIAYPKKNYTVKFDFELKVKEGWGYHKKYCLKADWIDFSHLRNVVSAKLWGDVVRSRAESDLVTRLSALPNCGAIDGFPCFVVINGEWQGIYNFNIPKDNYMFGMGSGTKEAILCAEEWSDPTLFKAEAALSTNFEVEYKSDTFSNSEILTSLNRLINAVRNSDGTDIDTTIAQYVDIDSAIDYLIFVQLLCHRDGVGKNYLLATYDGAKWFFSAYDLDCVFGNGYPAGKFDSAETNESVLSHKLFALLWTYKFEEIHARYKELVGSTMSQAAVDSKFNNYCAPIPLAAYNADVELWRSIPSTSVSNIAQIRTWYGERLSYIKERYKSGTKGLSYGIRDDFTANCLGMGTCVESNVEIAPSAYNRKVTVIAENAFKADTTLESVIIPEPVNTIANTAFINCTSLRKVTLPNTLMSFSYASFQGCTALKTVELPSSLVNVGPSTFQGCTGLVKVSLPKNFPKIQNRVFYGCSALKDIFYGGTMAEWGAIEKGTEWDANTGAYTVHCIDGDIPKATQ